MASKFQFITELYSRTLTRLTGDYESWTGFLRSACYNYKCPFDEQVLIYAQRPDATAVLELEKWNRQFGRWVNAGATGIAVMDEAHGKGRLKHYFDITDTHATRISRPVPIWSMEPAYTEPVIETLEATFGTLAEKDNLPDAILSASRNAVADNMQDYLRDLLDCRGGSMLEELDALNVEVTYRRALQSSVAYMLMTRLSLPAAAYILPEDFEGIYSFDMLNLPVPEAHYHNIALKPSEYQKEMVASLAERAEQVRNKQVDSSVDNMLLITNDGRKLALDQRLINPMLPADPESKAVKCAETVFDIWRRTAEKHSTQMIFCDLSTPKSEGVFSVYDDIRSKLVEMGVPENEIAYIHDAKTEAQKKDLFAKVRAGQVRVLLGSTQRMGAGTNCQQKLVALHHLDCPWRPADLQQREGRIIRQGNENAEVDIYSYVTEGTFDAYLYQLVERKQKFIAQIMTSKSPVRSAEDVDDQALSYAEIKALASGNPLIKEKMDLDIEVTKLKLLKSSHLSQRYSMEDAISKTFPKSIAETQERLAGYGADIAAVKAHTAPNEDGFSPMTLAGKVYTEKKAAGAELLAMCQNMLTPEATQVGSYRGLTLELSFDSFSQEYRLTMIGQLRHVVTLGTDVFGNIQRMDNLLESLPLKEQACWEKLSDLHNQLETAKVEVLKPFPREEELQTKLARLEELNALLNMDKREPEVVAETEAPDNSQQSPTRKTTELER